MVCLRLAWLLLPQLVLAGAFDAVSVTRFLDAFEETGAQASMSALRRFLASAADHAPRGLSSTTSLPPGPFTHSCSACTMDGETLACSCDGPNGPSLTSLSLSACAPQGVRVVNRGGFLQCDPWRDSPPPRVGAIIGPPDDVYRRCRVLQQTSFVAPQMLPSAPPLETRTAATPGACCAACTRLNNRTSAAHSDGGAKAPACRAWTLEHGSRRCVLLSSSNTAFPSVNSTSGYPLQADSATFCTQVAYHTFDKGDVYDRSMAPNVSCAFLAPDAEDGGAFPRFWRDSGQPAMHSTAPANRGTAWFFWPEPGGRCDCAPSSPPGNTTCRGPALNARGEAEALVAGRPWAVFVHGGRFVYLNALQEGYAMLASRVAAASGAGVLAVDYRTAVKGGALYPGGLLDVADAVRWLLAHNASQVFLYGDSSGGTQVIELLLLLVRHEPALAAQIAGAVGFSPWLDLSDSGPGYFSQRSCDGSCMATVMWPSVPMFDRRDGQCAARAYLPPNVTLTDSVASPLHALPSELARLPPLLLVLGGGEVLLKENFAFAQRLSAAGGAVQLEVWENMWHDFIEHSEGCKSGTPLTEALEAMEVAGRFIRDGAARGGCRTTRPFDGLACVRWHASYSTLPAVSPQQCG